MTTQIKSGVIAANAITGTQIAANAINATHLAAGIVVASDIADNSITSAKIAKNAIDSAELVSGSIDTVHIADSQVTNVKLANSSVTVNSNAVSLGSSITLDTDDIGEGSTNQYFTNARAQGAITVTDAGGDGSLGYSSGTITYTGPSAAETRAHFSAGTGVTLSSGQISIGQDVGTTATPTFGNITTTGYLAGPATFTIDPAAVGDNTGTVVIAGNLQVDGTTTTINSTTMTVDDLNITLASGAANAAAANGAGITVDTANATITYNGTTDSWEFNKEIILPNNVGLFFDNAAATAVLGIKANTSDEITFRTGGNWDRLVIDGSGNATFAGTISSGAITTTAPEFKYISSTDSNVGLLIRDETYVSDEADITASRLAAGNNLTLGLAGQAGINAYIGGVNKFSINSSGNATFAGRITANDDLYLQSDVDLHLIATNPNAGSSFQYGEITFGDSTSNQFINHAKIISSGNYANQSNLEFHTSDNNSSPLRLKIDPNGDISFYEDTGASAKLLWDASAESLSIGDTGSTTDRRFQVSATSPSTATTQFGIVVNPTYPTNVTNNVYNLYTGPNLATGTTLTNLYNIYLEANGYPSSTVTNSYGLYQSGANDKNYFAGAVGIGTNNPSANSKVTIESSSNQLRLTDGSLAYDIGYDNSYLRFKNSAGDTHAVINWSTGNIGIGTTSPDTKLHIVGNNSTRNSIVPNLTLDGGISASNPYDGFGFGINFIGRDYGNAIRNYGHIYSVIEDQSSSAGGGDAGFKSLLSFYTNSGGTGSTDPTEKMRITSSGKLLLGATSNISRGGASTKSLIKLSSTEAYLDIQAYDATKTGGVLFSSSSGGAYGLIDYWHSNNSMHFYTNSTDQMVIDNNGLTLGMNNIYFNGATNSSYISTNVPDITYNADGVHNFRVYDGGWKNNFRVVDGGVDIHGSRTYSANHTYSYAWTSSFQTIIPNGSLDGDATYIVSIWSNSFGTPPYYASASFIMRTAGSTNGGGTNHSVQVLTSHHVSSSSYWEIATTTTTNSTNGLAAKLVNGPNTSGQAIYVRASLLIGSF